MNEQDWFSDVMRVWAEQPWRMVREAFDIEPDAWQDDALHRIAKPETRRLAMKACKGPGKTALLAWVVWWFLATRWQAKVGCTSITEGNIDSNLWPELSKWQARSQFLTAAFSWTSTRINRQGDPNWFATKRTWPKSGNAEQQADALAGLHADHVMFVLDESGGIPQAVMVTAEAVLANEGVEGKVVQAGNPTHTTGPLYRACTIDRHLWEVVTITGDPDNPMRSPRISKQWANEQIASYGRDNPWVIVNVLGEFPPASINALLGAEDVERAMRRHLRPDSYQWAEKRLGVDVARFGDDRTVLFPRQGLRSWNPVTMRGARTTDITARIIRASTNWSPDIILIDDTGHWGHGVIDQLHAAKYNPMGVNYSGKAADPRYANKRVEMWLKGTQAIKDGAQLPYIPEMVGELTEPTYTFHGGTFVLEPKDEIKKRLGKSPDLADAYMTTYALPERPGHEIMDVLDTAHAETEFDPYAPSVAAHEFDPYK